jgi:pimeloyl-ACP methyl ester carboxylesterase
VPEDAAQWIRGSEDGTGLVVFVHGFAGDAVSTWKDFPDLLPSDPDLRGYDFCFWGYPTSVNPLIILKRLVWSDNPNLDTLGQGLRSLLDNTAQRYRKIVFAGHSMGGLIIQLFILEELSH